jgi:hypothetical protein
MPLQVGLVRTTRPLLEHSVRSRRVVLARLGVAGRPRSGAGARSGIRRRSQPQQGHLVSPAPAREEHLVGGACSGPISLRPLLVQLVSSARRRLANGC